MPHFDALKIIRLWKTNLNLSATFILSSANAFNWDQSKILSLGIELICHLQMDLVESRNMLFGKD